MIFMLASPVLQVSFDDPQESAATGAFVHRLALNGFPAVLAFSHVFSLIA
jgi:hypothetical protein